MASRRKQPKPKNVVKGHALNHNASTEERYQHQLEQLVMQMAATTNREILALFKSDLAGGHFGQDASISSQARILMNKLNKRFAALFQQKAKPYSEGMLSTVNQESDSNMTRSLGAISKGLTIPATKLAEPLHNVMAASIAENVDLIKSIPQQYLSGVSQAVMRSITTGNGLQDLQPYLEKQNGITKRRAENIAKDQTRKAYNNINAVRMKSAGVKKFEWLHSGGGRDPRPLHIQDYPIGLNGGIFSFDDLPVIDEKTGERGLPGQAPNCKCRLVPVIDFGDTDDSTNT